MNPLNIHHIKVEKANSIKLKYQKLWKVTAFFRALEILLILAVISRLSLWVPVNVTLAFKLFNEYLRSLLLLLVSPKFIFILGNTIVITLFVNSGHFSNPCEVKLPEDPQHEPKNTKPLPKERGITEENTIMTAIFATPPQEHHHLCEKLPKSPLHNHKNTKLLPKEQGITKESTMKAAIITAPPPDHQRQVAKIYQRSKSERPRRSEKTETHRSSTLQRSNTAVIKSLSRKEGCGEEAEEPRFPEDHMSNEEFRKTIEDFIAKQQMFLREEEDFSALESNFDL